MRLSSQQRGEVKVKFFLWPSLLISLALSVLLTIILNIIL